MMTTDTMRAPKDPESQMSSFTFQVTCEAQSLEQAQQVMAERLSHDESYGFDYTLSGASLIKQKDTEDV